MRKSLLLGLLVMIGAGCGGNCCDSDNSTSISDECILRAKKLNVALLIYASDYDDGLPPNVSWMDALTPYIFPLTVNFRCPVSETAGPTSYGFAQHTQIGGHNVNDFPAPENIITIFDSTNTTKNASGTETLLPNPARHNGLNTIARLDGSVRGVQP